MSEPGTAVDDLFEYITEICFIVLMYDGQLCCGSTLKVNIYYFFLDAELCCL